MTLHPLVVVGVDGTPDADAAVRWGAQYVEGSKGALLLVAAWSWPTFQDVPIQYGVYDPRKAGQELVQHAAALTGLPDEQLETRVAHGDPGRVLTDIATGADMLVVGAGGVRSVAGRLTGSVASHCVRHAPCPVVVVRAGHDEHRTGTGERLARAGS